AAAATTLSITRPPRPARAQSPAADARVHYAVDDPRDLPDAHPGDGLCAAAPPPGDAAAPCTLRAAFDEAGASGRATTIGVPAGAFTLTYGVMPPPATFPYIALDVPYRADIRLDGAGAGRTVIALQRSPGSTSLIHIAVAPGGRLAVSGVTFRGGLGLGGIMSEGHLSIADSALVDSQGDGALLDIEDGGSLTMSRTVVAGNTRTSGLAAWGPATVVSSTFQDNDFADEAVYAYAPVRVASSAIVRNRVGKSITQGSGTIDLRQSTVADNVIQSWYAGGSILSGGLVALDHVTVAGNRASVNSGRLEVVHAQRLVITATLIGDNGTEGAISAPAAGCVSGSMASHGASVVEQPACADPARGDRIVSDVDLGPLVDAGGPTPVRLPHTTSPAVGARASGCPAIDERGAPRPVGGPCAAGAAEPFAPSPPPGLLWPIAPSFLTRGPEAPTRADGVPGPPGVLAIRGGRAVVARGRQAQALGITGGAVAVDGGFVDLPSPAIGAAIDGATAWLMDGDGVLTAVDLTDRTRPTRLSVIHDPVERDLGYPVVYLQLAVPTPGVLWRMGWRGVGMRGLPGMFADVWDITRPAWPRRVRTISLGYGTTDRNVAWRAGRIVTASKTYVGMGGSVRALRAFDPDNPLYTDGLALDGTPNRVSLQGDHAFVLVRERDKKAPDGILVVDVRDAANPVALGWWPEPWDDVVAAPDGVLLQRGDVLAVADLSDPLRPRIVSQAVWPSPPVALRATDTAVIARLANGRDAVVDLSSPDGPRPIDVPTGGAVVQAAAGGGEDLVWRAPDGAWRVADPAQPARERFVLPEGGGVDVPVTTSLRTTAVAGGVVWQATAGGITGYDAARPGRALAVIDVRGATAIAAAADGGLWALEPSRLTRWNVAGRPPDRAHAWPIEADDPPRHMTADDGGAALWSETGRVWRVPLDDVGSSLPSPLAVRRPSGAIVAAAMDVDRLVVLDDAHVSAYAVAGAEARAIGGLAVPGTGRGLAVAGGRGYVVAGGWLYVVDLTGDRIEPLVKVPAPGATGPIAIAGGRLFVAAADNGLLAYDVGAPDRPRLLARCGETWPGERAMTVVAPGADTIDLRQDGRPVAEGAPAGTSAAATNHAPAGADALTSPSPLDALAVGIATLRLSLDPGRHRIDAVARRESLPPRFSSPLYLDARPKLLFDPLGVTFDDGAPGGPRPALDPAGCSSAADGWTVRLDASRAVTVAVPLRADLATTAAVTVTLASRTTRLAPRPGDATTFVGVIAAANGPGGTSASGSETVVEVRAGTERVVWRGQALRPRLWLPWAGR
ncbi:MAG: choice-of-anchor Q domain-containing protein, partial [Ardenticatenales bacterium]